MKEKEEAEERKSRLVFFGQRTIRPTMTSVGQVFEMMGSFVLVSLIWGVTNPFLGRAAKGGGGGKEDAAGLSRSTASSSPQRGFIASALLELVKFFLNWRFWVPYAINQSGSLLYNYLLGTSDISLASPICNSLTFVVTGITAKLLGERQPVNWKTVSGAALIVGGVALCVAAKLDVVASQEALTGGGKGGQR